MKVSGRKTECTCVNERVKTQKVEKVKLDEFKYL